MQSEYKKLTYVVTQLCLSRLGDSLKLYGSEYSTLEPTGAKRQALIKQIQ